MMNKLSKLKWWQLCFFVSLFALMGASVVGAQAAAPQAVAQDEAQDEAQPVAEILPPSKTPSLSTAPGWGGEHASHTRLPSDCRS